VRYLTPKDAKVTRNPPPFSYTFSGDKVTLTLNEKAGANMTLVADKKRRDAFEMTRDKSTITTKYFFKIEKGELFLVPNRSADPNAKPDFSGDTAQVLVLEKEKK